VDDDRDLAAWAASVTAFLGLVLLTDAALSIFSIYKQQRQPSKQASAAEAGLDGPGSTTAGQADGKPLIGTVPSITAK